MVTTGFFDTIYNKAAGGNFWITDTDYDNYAVIYSCQEFFFGLYHTELVMVFTRENDSDSDTYAEIGLDRV